MRDQIIGVEINKKNSFLLCQRHICVVKVMVENAGRDKSDGRKDMTSFSPRYQWHESRNLPLPPCAGKSHGLS